MIQSGKFDQKKILIVDKDEKKKNDRTWSFWEKEQSLFEPIVYKEWKKTWVHGEKFSRLLELSPYKYKLIRGIDFYTYCFNLIRQHPNFEIRMEAIEEIKSKNGKSWIQMGEEKIFAEYIFNSVLFDKPVLKKNEYYLLQHFKGWIIETDTAVFNPAEATLMDFRVSQQHGTAFFYIKPFTERKAMVEYTLFTEKLLEPSQYEEGLKDYVKKILKIDSYKITEEEFGIIPMTNHRFRVADGGIINIGTAGGQTKASSGYTFRFIQKHSAKIVETLIKRKNPFVLLPAGRGRFRFYDSTLLYILKHNQPPGDKIFMQLFRKNKPQQVLRFLDNESSVADELKIFSTLPTWPFLKAAIKQL